MVGVAFVLLGINAIYSNLFVSQVIRETEILQEGSYRIKIENFDYSISIIEIRVGDTVFWENFDSVKHTVTSEDAGPLNSTLLAKDEIYFYTFNETGVYPYFCKLHPYMKGMIVVK